MKNILVIFTGGTIGSTVQNNSINTDESTAFLLLNKFNERYFELDVSFTVRQPYQILSENLSTRAWESLISAIENENPENYDGVIVTHGTDTLAYTSSALSLYFHSLSVPIFFVSSYSPLSNEDSNGLDNFHCAVNEIITSDLKGVFIPYRNPKSSTVTLHKAEQFTSSPQLSNHFFSVNNAEKSELTLNFSAPLTPKFSERILLIKPYPSLNYDYFDLTSVDAVLHDLYHSGTACTTENWGKNYSLLNFIKRCREKNIAVYIAPILKSEDAYQSTVELIDAGAILLWNLTLEMAFAKLSMELAM